MHVTCPVTRRAKAEKENDVSWKEKKRGGQQEGLKYNTFGPPITRSTAREYRDMLVALVGG